MGAPLQIARIARRIGSLSPATILALGWAAMLVYGFPGLLSFDSAMQLLEARDGFYTDAHPPVMARLWRFIDLLLAGSPGMFVIQTGMFLGGLYLVLVRALPARRAALAAVLLALFPPLLAPMAAIWKDSWMAALLLLGAAGVMAERRSARIAGLVALLFATALRYNAPAATGPLIVLCFVWTYDRGIKRYALALATWLVVSVLALGIGELLTDQKMHFWHSSNALFDTAGTLAETSGTLPDEVLRELTEGTGLLVSEHIHDAIRRRYKPLDYEPLIAGEGHLWNMPITGRTPAPQATRDAIGRMYRDVLTAHPVAFVRHRWEVWRRVLGLYDGPVHAPVFMHKHQHHDLVVGLGQPPRASPLQRSWQQKLYWFARKTPLFRPWLWLAIALLVLPLARAHRDIMAILLSGIGLEASLFLAAPTPDYRYSHWMIVCTCVAVVMLIARRART